MSECFVLFVEPETREGRALTECYRAHGIASLERCAVTESLEFLFKRMIGVSPSMFRVSANPAALTRPEQATTLLA